MHAPVVAGSMRLEAFAVRPSVIPEPSTAVLMGLGLTGLASRRR
ncbi:MAG: PEP-CTERM sorting domain-containing protein [Proteobacteria bacterium]|nr:PEP-CTERM sorting domain-containing protein [Pseudomonadota bacterium]